MSRASRLAELRALRASGKTRLSTYQVQEEPESLYEEVDEEGYKRVVRARLDQDDFVVDDNGDGYADDGREEWMDERGYNTASGSEAELPLKGKAGEELYIFLASTSCVNSVQQRGNVRRIEKRQRRLTTSSAITLATVLLLPLQSLRYEPLALP